MLATTVSAINCQIVRKKFGLTAEYPATSKITPKFAGYADTRIRRSYKNWLDTRIRGYADNRMRRGETLGTNNRMRSRETLGTKLQELAGYADTLHFILIL